ncbi:MAG: hypothetical protein DRP47_10200 [Candidatus Zixiibacteriota bacterium]|nr:MAG: hypothetical protein DRP47_10200 [candidate division Zixibacteria bacterium]
MVIQARQKAIVSAIWTVSTWLLVILLIAGMNGFSGQAAFQLSNGSADYPETNCYVCDYPPAPGSDGADMTPDGLPAPKAPAYMALPLLYQTDNSIKRGIHENRYTCCMRAWSFTNGSNRIITTSTSLISSRLAQQLTLVGAKPSGTG